MVARLKSNMIDSWWQTIMVTRLLVARLEREHCYSCVKVLGKLLIPWCLCTPSSNGYLMKSAADVLNSPRDIPGKVNGWVHRAEITDSVHYLLQWVAKTDMWPCSYEHWTLFLFCFFCYIWHWSYREERQMWTCVQSMCSWPNRGTLASVCSRIDCVCFFWNMIPVVSWYLLDKDHHRMVIWRNTETIFFLYLNSLADNNNLLQSQWPYGPGRGLLSHSASRW